MNEAQMEIDDYARNLLGTKHEQLGFYYRYKIPKEDGRIKIVDVPKYNLMATKCFSDKQFCFDDATSLKFDGKKWNWLTRTALHNFIIQQNKECITPSHIDNFAKIIRGTCHQEAMEIEPPEGLVNVSNGVVNVKENRLVPHNYKYLFKYCTPIEYNQSAKSELWRKFLDEIFAGNPELIDLSQRLFGYILMGGQPFLERAFVLVGDGRNGKSTFLNILRAIIGPQSYSTVSMGKIDKEFSIVNIDGKLANIVEETPNEEINAEIFKNMVGGGEIQAAHKGFDEYTFKCNARFVFACNEMPVFKDKSVGLEDRLVIIPFDRYFREDERDTKIKEKLLTELPGILNWAIAGARTMEQERSLPAYEITKKAKESYRMSTDPLYSWFKEVVEITSNPRRVLTVKEIYDRYSADMEESGNRPYSKDKFSKRLRKLVQFECEVSKVNYDAEFKTSDAERGYEVLNVRGLDQTNLKLTGQTGFKNYADN